MKISESVLCIYSLCGGGLVTVANPGPLPWRSIRNCTPERPHCSERPRIRLLCDCVRISVLPPNNTGLLGSFQSSLFTNSVAVNNLTEALLRFVRRQYLQEAGLEVGWMGQRAWDFLTDWYANFWFSSFLTFSARGPQWTKSHRGDYLKYGTN